MKKGQVKRIKCFNCGKLMRPVKDKIKKTYISRLRRCDCRLEGVIISAG